MPYLPALFYLVPFHFYHLQHILHIVGFKNGPYLIGPHKLRQCLSECDYQLRETLGIRQLEPHPYLL